MANQAHAAPDFGPPVFDQQQDGTVNPIAAKVVEIHESGDGYAVTLTKVQAGESDVTEVLSLCTNDKAVNAHYTEADRAMAIHERVHFLREAKTTQNIVPLAVHGPWSPCVAPISI